MKISIRVLTAALLAAVAMTACSPTAGGPALTETALPTASPSPFPQPTSTPAPTVTPIPTATPIGFSSGAEMGLVEQLVTYGHGLVYDVQYAPQGGEIAFATSAGVYLLEAESFNVTGHVPVDGTAYRIAFSADGGLLAIGTIAGDVIVLDVNRDIEVAHIAAGVLANVMAFSPDGQYLAVADEQDQVVVWKTADWETKRSIYARSPSGLVFTADSASLLVATPDRVQVHTCCTWSMSGTIDRGRFDGTTVVFKDISAIDISPDGSLLAIGMNDQETIAVLEVPTWKGYFVTVMDPRPGEMRYPWVNGLSFSSSGKRLAFIGRPRSGWINLVTRELSFQHSTSGARTVAISPGADRAVLDGSLYDVVAWTFQRAFEPNPIGNAVSYFPPHERSPGGRWQVKIDDREGTVALWDTGSDTALFSLRGHYPTVVAVLPQSVGDVAWAQDESFFVTGGYDRQVKLWHVAADPQPLLLGSLPDMVLAVAVSADGSKIAAGDGKGNFVIWGYFDGKSSELVRGSHPASVFSAARAGQYILAMDFSPDGRILATGGSPTIALWRVSDGTLLAVLEHGVRVEDLQFADDGLMLYSKYGPVFGDDELIRGWGVKRE